MIRCTTAVRESRCLIHGLRRSTRTALVEAGIFKSKNNEHQLGPFWRNDEVLQAIDAFAARAGRPNHS